MKLVTTHKAGQSSIFGEEGVTICDIIEPNVVEVLILCILFVHIDKSITIMFNGDDEMEDFR